MGALKNRLSCVRVETLRWRGAGPGTLRGSLLLLSCFSRVQLCVTPQTAAHQVPPSLGLSRQELCIQCCYNIRLGRPGTCSVMLNPIYSVP